LADLPDYSFLPWSRRGIATRIAQGDDLGAHPDAGPKDRATFVASITLTSVAVAGAAASGPAAASQTVALVGPGDIKNLKPDTVLRAMPVPGTGNATPGELAYVEFYDEDLPWRHTPAAATADAKLRPWLTLLVLAEGEYTLTRSPGELSILSVTDQAPLPPPTETWAWAHVQTTGDLTARGAQPGDALDDHVTTNPDLALSRLVSPRRLESQTSYHGFVVPTFEAGRLTGLGRPATPGVVPAQQPAWGGKDQPRVFPVYFDWAFRTGELAGFEVLARRPKAYPVEAAGFGVRDMDIADPGAGIEIPAGTTVAFEGALRPLDVAGRLDFPASPGAAVSDQLRDLIDLAADYVDPETSTPGDEDPIVVPPAYARRHAGLARVAEAGATTAWVAELNLDPRNRAAAGLGAEIVRGHDEEYIERAWAQVEEIDAVNQRLREAELAMTASDRIFAKHVAPAGPDRLLGLATAAQSMIRSTAPGDGTIRGEVDTSRVPAAAQAPAFRRITRPTRPLMRRLGQDAGAGLRDGLLDRLNEDAATAVSTAPPAPEPVLGLAASMVATAATAVAGQVPSGREVFVVLAGDEVEFRRVHGALDGSTLADVRNGISDRIDAAYPPPGAGDVVTLRQEATALLGALAGPFTPGTGDEPTVLHVAADTFAEMWGRSIDGKAYLGVVVARGAATTFAALAAAASPQSAADLVSSFGDFTTMVAARPEPPPAVALTAPGTLATEVAMQLRPQVALPARLATVLGGAGDLAAGLANQRRLPPVMAYPTFDDALFEPLRELSQDYIIPSIANLPPESIALMVPNVRFIESLLAGVNTELARELLWNEYPTDQRGTYFARFFDAADAGEDRPPDIPEIHRWQAALGTNSPQLAGLLVLVVRAELLVKFPDLIVFAQHGVYTGVGTRTLDLAGEVRYPVVRGWLDPDISLFGFEMTPLEAAGTATDAGFFFCFMERPGQLRFGLDLDDDGTTPAPALATWDDLNWKHLQVVGGQPPAQILVTANAGLHPTTAGLPAWGQTSAHLAAILAQSPVWLARHATDMLPVDHG
jgi:hypothetical protein